jgi:predicted MFS family arabinose efflux permease
MTATAPLRPLERSEILLILMLALVQFTHIMDFMIMMPLGPQLMRIFQITPREFGFLVSAYTFTAGASGFFGAFFVDRFDRKSALIFCYVGFTLATLACSLSPTYGILMASRSMAGAFGGVLGALILSAIGDAVAPDKRGRAMGLVMASFSLASVFGVPFGIYLSTLFSWHAPFVFVVGVAVLNLIMLVMKMPSMRGHFRTHHHTPAQVLGAIASDRNQLRALLFTLVLMLSAFVMIPFLSPSMVANVGFKESELAWIYLFGGGVTVFTSALVGRFADRYGKAKVFTYASFLVVIPMLLVSHMGPTPLWIALGVTSLFFVGSNGRFVPSTAMVTSVVPPQTRGSFMSINSSVQSLGSGSASLLAGLIIERADDGRLLHYEIVGYIAVFFTLVAVWGGRGLQTEAVRVQTAASEENLSAEHP